MAEDRNALTQHYERMREQLDSVIDGLSDEQLADPSIDGWSVKDHLAHIALWHEARAAEVERISAGYEPAFPMTGDQDDAYNKLAYDLRKGWSPAQAKWELDRARQRLLEAISAATPRGLDGSLYGEAGLRSSHEEEHAGWIKRWRGERVL